MNELSFVIYIKNALKFLSVVVSPTDLHSDGLCRREQSCRNLLRNCASIAASDNQVGETAADGPLTTVKILNH